MLNKLVRIKNLIIAVFLIVFLVFWTFTLLFCNANQPDKVILLIVSIVVPLIVYVVLRVMCKYVVKCSILKEMKTFIFVALSLATVFWILMIVEYITVFPNGMTGGFGSSQAFIAAVLEGTKQLIEKENSHE